MKRREREYFLLFEKKIFFFGFVWGFGFERGGVCHFFLDSGEKSCRKKRGVCTSVHIKHAHIKHTQTNERVD